MIAARTRIRAVLGVIAALGGCMTEADHINPTTLPNGKPGFLIVCNSQHYDRCLSRAAKTCNGPYAIVPQVRDTVRFGDSNPLVGNNESILVSCGDTAPQGK
jgi:hypothetical protein